MQLLDRLDERLVRVVECRFFVGLTEEETAEALETSLSTVQREWKRAKAWLKEAMRDGVM
jgi:RNA polymerase sigma factor (sigma-70 family)